MSARTWLLGFATAAACRGGTGGTATSSAPTTITPAATAGPMFPGMFERGARWRFQLSYVSDAEGADRPELTTGECWVEDVVAFDGGRATYLECSEGFGESGDGSRNPIPGIYAERADGTYRLVDWPAEGKPLVLGADDERWIPNPPVASSENTPDPPDEDVHEERNTILTVEPDGDAWCYSHVYGATFGWSQKLCFDARGPRSGEWTWETVEVMYTTTFQRIDPEEHP